MAEEKIDNPSGIGLFGLIGLVVSSCIGSGVFALTGQLAAVASPGAALIGWVITGLGFTMLALSINNIANKEPGLNGVFSYAEEGFGPLAGFISGWGYWLSAWLGNVAFATMMMQTLGYFWPQFAAGNTVTCIVIASVVMWALTFLVINGVESASFINAIVMVVKVVSLIVFIIFCFAMFNAGVFTADFWGTLHDNAVAAAGQGVELGSVSKQVMGTLLITMWSFIGIEGASVVSKRAMRKSDAGKATIIGIVVLLFIYIAASILPYGYMPYEQVAALHKPAVLYVFDSMLPGLGGDFISIAIVISILGSWLSFTILPSETTDVMAERHLVPAKWGEHNQKNSPQFSLILVGICTQVFLFTLLFTEDAYNFAMSMCTVAIVFTWACIAAYQMKISKKSGEKGQYVIGLIALIFQIAGCLFSGWSFLLLTCIGYIPGFFVFKKARLEADLPVYQGKEKLAVYGVTAAGILAIVLMAMGVITI